jgi:cleavage and polyadenylation specificity factor subunit 2
VPTKFISERVELTIRCRIASIDYEGRSDGESIKKIVSSIKPRNLILVHGSSRSTTEMREFCTKQQTVSGSVDRIFAPRVGELVDATLDTQIYNVRLTDELVSSLKFHKLRDYELAWVDAVVKAKEAQNPENEFGTTTTASSTNIDYGFSLHPVPRDLDDRHKTVFVNEPKLSDLKQILLHNDIQAEFHGGVLVCNKLIALKKVYNMRSEMFHK